MALVRSFVSPEEIHPGRVVTYEEVAALARSLNRSEALHFLGFLNLLLSAAAAETHLTNRLEPVHEVQTKVFREVVSQTLLDDLRAKLGNASLLDRPILHRSQLLFAIRLVATHGDAVGGNMLVHRPDFDAVGDLLFLINGLFRVDPPKTKASTPLWLATQMAPMYEMENPPQIELAWPRTEELLTERLPKAASDPAELDRLEQIAVFTTGFNTRAWVDLSWMLFSYWADATFKALMDNRGRGYLNPDADQTVLSREALRRALEAMAARFDDVPAHLRIEDYSRTTLFDLTPFRMKPLWLMPDGLVLCVDSLLLVERLGPHVFWTMMNALDTPERRRRFAGTWGLAFESYCLDQLQVFAAKSWTYLRNPKDTFTNEELSDAVAVRQTSAVLVECKGTFMTSAEKYSGVPGRFMRGLTQKFGNVKHGGMYQLIRAISHVWVEQLAPDSVPKSTSTTDVFPILVVQDPAVGCNVTARVLSDRFDVAMKRASSSVTHKMPRVWPLTVVSIDELDRLAAAVKATGQPIDSVLKRFHRTHPSRMVSLGEFMSSAASADFSSAEKLKPIVQARFKATTEPALQRFRDGDYGGAPELDVAD